MRKNNNTEDLLNYFVNHQKLSFKKNETIFLNMSDYFIEMIEEEKNRIFFYTNLFEFINNLSDIQSINASIDKCQEEYDEILKEKEKEFTEEELILKAQNIISPEREKVNLIFNEKEEALLLALKQKNIFLNFFNKNFYFLLNNIYYNYELIKDLFINFLEKTNNDDFITIVIEHSKRRLNKDLLIDIVKHYNVNKTHVNIIISMNINELTLLIMELHEDKILRYNEIFNTCFFSNKNELEKLLSKKDNKYIRYISEYLKRNDFETKTR